jgi:hypothetical protein
MHLTLTLTLQCSAVFQIRTYYSASYAASSRRHRAGLGKPLTRRADGQLICLALCRRSYQMLRWGCVYIVSHLWGSGGYMDMYIIVCVFVQVCVSSCYCHCVLLGFLVVFLGIDLDGTTMLDSDRLSLPVIRQKRRHTKSRNGCGTCKLRRVKVSFFSFPSCSYLID